MLPQARGFLSSPLWSFLAIRIIFGVFVHLNVFSYFFHFCPFCLSLISFFVCRFITLSMYLGSWRAYAVPVVPSKTMAWLCVVYALLQRSHAVHLCRSLVTTDPFFVSPLIG